MKKVQHGNSKTGKGCNTKKVQYEKNASRNKCNKKVKHECDTKSKKIKEIATWKDCNTRKVNHGKSETQK